MRIQEISKLTGLSKKTLHFYINEGLVSPKKSENNYYEFSEEDVTILKQIIVFRKAGLSIQTIKEVYDYPAATNFFLHRSFNELKQEIADKMMQLQNLEAILNTIPPNGTPVHVGNIPTDFLKQIPDTGWINQMHPSVDERIIALLVLAPFMDITVDEYKTYLWSKIISDLKYHLKDNTKIIARLIYSLNGPQIKEMSAFQFELMKGIATSDDVQVYVNHLIERIEQMCNDKELLEKWKLLYHPLLVPIANFLKTTTNNKRINQYNPLLDQCISKFNVIISVCMQKLQGTELEQRFKECIGEYINRREGSYSDLYILLIFHKSIYARCSIDAIKEALK